MEYTIKPRLALGDTAYGICQRRIMNSVICSKCNGLGEIVKDRCAFYCTNCKGSGTVTSPSMKWFVDEEPMTVTVIRATISKNQTVFKYKGRANGSTYSRGDSTLFASPEEAAADCDRRNGIS